MSKIVIGNVIFGLPKLSNVIWLHSVTFRLLSPKEALEDKHLYYQLKDIYCRINQC